MCSECTHNNYCHSRPLLLISIVCGPTASASPVDLLESQSWPHIRILAFNKISRWFVCNLTCEKVCCKTSKLSSPTNSSGYKWRKESLECGRDLPNLTLELVLPELINPKPGFFLLQWRLKIAVTHPLWMAHTEEKEKALFSGKWHNKMKRGIRQVFSF